jgi:chloramphenicol 3-O phosphotransferase
MDRVRRGDFAWRDLRDPFFAGFHGSVGAFLAAGNNLILEHILDGTGWAETLRAIFAPHDVLFVGLRTGLEELKWREAARGDRPAGSAEVDFHAVHEGFSYDLELAGDGDLEANVERLLAAWRAPRGKSAFFDA